MNPNIRKILFWDIEYSNLNWILNKNFIIKRVFERGSLDEISELYRFYGHEQINEVLNSLDGLSERIKCFILLFLKNK